MKDRFEHIYKDYSQIAKLLSTLQSTARLNTNQPLTKGLKVSTLIFIIDLTQATLICSTFSRIYVCIQFNTLQYAQLSSVESLSVCMSNIENSGKTVSAHHHNEGYTITITTKCVAHFKTFNKNVHLSGLNAGIIKFVMRYENEQKNLES